jgi:VIT1/CCC1 family predicted Fe2+/Mn2+ transporter
MAAGEYVSVSSQRAVELADLERERRELAESPEGERSELVGAYEAKGLSTELAARVADALVAKEDPLRVHAREELGLDPDRLARPVQAAGVSALSFAAGAALPLAVITLMPPGLRTSATVATALAILALLGGWSARLGGAPVRRAIVRVVAGGALAMGLTAVLGGVFAVAP